jgi:hypothetical protein
VCAQTDAGGGLSTSSSFTNQSSIGSPVQTGTTQSSSYSSKSGPVEVVFNYTIGTPVDTNGLPDAWEIEHFGQAGVDPREDADRDGTSNLMEYLAGTNPRTEVSRFQLMGTYSGAVFNLPIQTAVGRTYRVLASRNLQSWIPLQTYTGDGGIKIFSFDETKIADGPLYSPTHPSKYFFRVEVALP